VRCVLLFGFFCYSFDFGIDFCCQHLTMWVIACKDLALKCLAVCPLSFTTCCGLMAGVYFQRGYYAGQHSPQPCRSFCRRCSNTGQRCAYFSFAVFLSYVMHLCDINCYPCDYFGWSCCVFISLCEIVWERNCLRWHLLIFMKFLEKKLFTCRTV